MILEEFSWEAKVSGKRFGSGFEIMEKDLSHEQIADIVVVLSAQIKDTLQKVMTGETDSDRLLKISDFKKTSNLGG